MLCGDVMNITIDRHPDMTDSQIQAKITFHAGEISKMSIQLLDPFEFNKNIIRNSIVYHRGQLTKLGRILK